MKTKILLIILLIATSCSEPTKKEPKLTLEKIIEREAIINNVEPQLIKAIIKIESSGRPEAISEKNCRGLMQINPEHLDYFGFNEVEELHDVENNIQAGVRLLKEELDRFGNVTDALRAYNCGAPGAMRYKNCGRNYAGLVLETLKGE